MRTTASFAQRVLIGLVQAYRLLFKAWLGPVCRFEPSCSAYALQALERHGAARGGTLAARRLLRCHPWCDGGYDPVPEACTRPGRGLFTSLFPSPVRVAPESPEPPSPPASGTP